MNPSCKTVGPKTAAPETANPKPTTSKSARPGPTITGPATHRSGAPKFLWVTGRGDKGDDASSTQADRVNIDLHSHYDPVTQALRLNHCIPFLDIEVPEQTSPKHSSVSSEDPSTTNFNDCLLELSQERQDTILPVIRNGPHPSIRIILTAHTPDEHSLYFEPVTFELVNKGSPVILSRSDCTFHKTATVVASKISFATHAVTRGGHARIWLRDERILIKDMGSSAGTWVNHVRLEHPHPTSRAFELKDGDLITLGQDGIISYHQHCSSFPFKRVMGRISIKRISTEIALYCRSNCHCTWRAVFDRLGIYPLQRPVSGPRQIYEAINMWIRSPELSRRLESLNSEGEFLVDVIEKVSVVPGSIIEYKDPAALQIIETMSYPSISSYEYLPEELTPNEVSSCHSWIRKVARKSGAFPRSLVLHGVKKVNNYPIACGGFSDIYLGAYKDISVAMKVIRFIGTAESSRRVYKEFSHEALLWRQLHHPHILPFMGICHDHFSYRLVLVSPWMVNGDILRYLEKHPQKDRLSLLLQCVLGLKYLHGLDPALVHGDIKAGNILIDDEGSARLSDFGLLTISETQNFVTTFHGGEHKGTLRWMAPELFLHGEKKSRASDIYAFGMTIIEVYTGKPPFSGVGYNSDLQVMMAVGGGARHPRPNASTLICKLSNELWELVECCQKERKSRSNVQHIADELNNLVEIQNHMPDAEMNKLLTANVQFRQGLRNVSP